MIKTWRWFGKNDPITLSMLRQIGVEGVVTSLYHVPSGVVWKKSEIEDLKSYIEAEGLKWSVVESVPIHEAIKYGGDNRDDLIENFRQTLVNLGDAGIKIVCYNFMPVIDWIRTDLNRELTDGTQTLFFDKIKFAYFDCKILNRKGAAKNYTLDELQQVEALSKSITKEEINDLINTVIIKTQGFISRKIAEDGEDPVEAFNKLLSLYDGVDKNKLQDNLLYFLEQIIPTAEKYNIKMAIHPDDPPFEVLGLPRIVTNEQDIEWILKSVESKSNGLTFCAGSLSSGMHNDMVAMAKKFLPHIHFVHLRSTEVFENGDFIEAPHLEGRGQLIELIQLFEKNNPSLPMRVDHGKLMLDDTGKNYNPGYSFLGRMYALAQIDGVMTAVNKDIKQNKIER